MLFLVSSVMFSQELTPKEIIKKIDDTERVMSSKSTIKQTITTSGGDERTMEMLAYSKDKNDKQLMIYEAPSRVKGDKILMLNDGDGCRADCAGCAKKRLVRPRVNPSGAPPAGSTLWQDRRNRD